MRKLLFIIAFTVVSASQVFGQQKIKDGTSTSETLPNKDALLELESLNKGLLHVRLELKALSDPSPLSAHTAGMMVYNTKSNADIRPGLYYNDGARWVLLEASGAHEEIVTTLVDNENGTYTYTSEDGTETVIDIPADVVSNFQTILEDQSVRNAITNLVKQSGGNVHYDGDIFTYVTEEGEIEEITFRDIVRAHETITTLEDNGNGTYTYTNEAGDQVIIDVPAEVINEFETIIHNNDVQDVLNEYIINKVAGNVSYDGDNFYYVDENGNTVLIDVVNSVVKDIVNQGDVYEEIVNLIDTLETVTTLVDNGNGTFTYANEEGDNVTFDATRANITENSDGTFTIVDADGNQIVIDSIHGVINDIVNQGDIYNEIINLIDGNETVTSLEDNGDGTYTYTSEDSTKTVIDVPASVVENFETIVNDGPVTIHGETFNTVEEYLSHVANESVTLEGSDFITVTGSGTDADPYVVSIEEGADNSLLITNDNGELEWATIEGIVQGAETVTLLEDNGDGTYTYTSEDSTKTVIDVPASVVENFETIVNDGPVTIHGETFNTVEEYLSHVANESVTLEGSDFINVTGSGTDADPYVVSIEEGADNSLLITNDNGELEWATIEDIVQDAETVTLLEDNGDGTYTYTSEDSTKTVIDVPASVVENFETIVNDGPVEVNGDTFNTVEEYIIQLAEDVSNVEGSDFITVTGSGTDADPYVVSIEEGADNSLLITNDNGELEWATIEDIVQDAETVTLLEDNGDGTYTYTSEDSTKTVIDVPASVVENFETIVNDGPVTIHGDTFNTVEEYLSHVANESVTLEGSDFITVTGSGTDADPYVVSIEEGADNSLLITNDNGELEWATIEDIVTANETLTVLADNGNGTFTYTDENGDDVTFDATRSAITDNGDGTYTVKDADGNDVIIDIPGDIIHNFETIVQSGPVTVNNETYTTVEEYFQDLIETNETLTELDYDAVTNQLNFKDENGTTHNIQLNNTSLTYDDVEQELVYVDSEGNTTTINLNDFVNSNINTGSLTTTIDERIDIINGTDALLHDVRIDVNEGKLMLQNIGGTLQVSQVENGGPGQILVTNEGGNGVTWADPLAIAKGDLTSNDIEVTDGTNSILRDVSLEIKEGAITTDKLDDKAVTADKLDGGAGADDRVGVADADGDITYVTLDEVVKDNETLTAISYDDDANTITYIDEEGNDTVLDLNVGSVTYDGDSNTISYVDANGDTTDIPLNTASLSYEDATEELVFVDNEGNITKIDLGDLVTANETVTVLEDNGDGTYTYTSEDSTKTVIDVPASVVENFETIVNDGPVTIHGDTFNTVEEYLSHVANESVTLEGSDFITVTGSGTDADPYVVSIEEGADNSLLITNDNGKLEWATIEDIVQDAETVTRIEEEDGIYTYYNEEGTPFVIDIPSSVVENFEEVYNQIVNEEIIVDGDTYTSFEEYLTQVINNATAFADNDFIEVSGDGSATDPYKITIVEGDANSMLITNDTGELEWATIEDIVQDAETVTRIEEEDGIYTYYNEEDTPFVIDIPSSVVENFEEVYNQIVNEEIVVDGDTYTSFEEYLTQVINNATSFEDNGFIEVSGDGSTADPYKITIVEGDANSMLITNDAGELEWMTIEDVINDNIDATNGLTKVDSEIKLGGTLIEQTTITTDATNTLAIEGLEQGTDTDNIVVADPATGILKQMKAAMPKFFYMPSIIVPTSQEQLDAPNSGKVTGDSFNDATRQGTLQLYGRYDVQFGSPMQSNTNATTILPVLPADELDYHITWYDTEVFESVSVSDTGVMTYTVKQDADITIGSFMNIVFAVKQD